MHKRYFNQLLFLLFFASSLTATGQSVRTPHVAQMYQTAEATNDRLTQKKELTFRKVGQPLETQPCVFIDPKHSFQTIIGIGGAITDASAEVFASLAADQQQELLDAYFNKEKGIAYSFARTPIASSDFSSASYDYIKPGDAELKTFDISHDKKYRIPLIKRAIATSENNLKLFISPWSPPAWMKDNNDRLHGGKLLEKYKQSWANHYVHFINAYQKEGISIWGLTIQNEPMAIQKWESCVYTAEEERDFVKKYLGPTLLKAGMQDKKLIVWDHNRDLIYQRASTILNDPESAKYVWGIGFHWYETWTGGQMQFNNLRQVHEAFPDKKLVFTEGCAESFNPQRYNAWELGERYGTSMLNDFNCGTVAWTDWNILLNEKGGPNHVGNFCFAPVHADLSNGKLIYTNSYYYIGHFSKFIKPGAKRIGCSASRDNLQATAFLNPNGKIVVIVLNTSDKEVEYQLWENGMAAKTKSLPHSIVSFVIH